MNAISDGSKHAASPMSRSKSNLQSPRLSNAGSPAAGSSGRGSMSSKNELKEQMKQASELEKRIEADEKTRVKEEMIAKGEEPHKMIVMPKYKLDERL